MSFRISDFTGGSVVLLAEDVDRNKPATTAAVGLAVVLLAEDVDRNMLRCAELGLSREVVLLAEDVDRNPYALPLSARRAGSSSSRRTWIEILRTVSAS